MLILNANFIGGIILFIITFFMYLFLLGVSSCGYDEKVQTIVFSIVYWFFWGVPILGIIISGVFGYDIF